MRSYRNAPRSLREILVASESFGERDFIVFEETRWTFAEHARKGPCRACENESVLPLPDWHLPDNSTQRRGLRSL